MPEKALRSGGIRLLRWLLAPATDAVPRLQAVAAAGLRILLGLLWLYNVSWKRAPDFGQDAGNGLYKFTRYAVTDPVFPPFSWLIEHLVLPVFTPFGWTVLVVETTLAVMLLTGAWVRLAAAIGLAQSVAIALSVAFAPHEWPWSYWLMIGAHAMVLLSSAGRVLAVDGARSGLATMRTLGQFWGALTLLLGGYSVLASVADPLAERGPGLVSVDLSISLGQYNLIGGLVLVVVGVLLALAARGGPRVAALVAAGLAVAAGLSLHAQLGFTDPALGGTATSAAFYFAVAVVALAVGRTQTSSSAQPSAIDALLARAQGVLDRVEPQHLADEVAAGARVVDMRPSEQRQRDGALPGAIVIDRNVLEWRLDPSSPHRRADLDLDVHTRVILVCNEGYSSSLAAATLRDLGLRRATDLIGGYQAWLSHDRVAHTDAASPEG